MPEPGDKFPEALVLRSELAALTPLESGRTTGTELSNTSLLFMDNEGVHGAFPYGAENVDTPIIEFLRGGDLPSHVAA